MKSRRFSVRSSVLQGSLLGPLLFILFIHYVFSCFKLHRILLYADLKIFFPFAGNNDFANAQAEFHVFSTPGCSSTWKSVKLNSGDIFNMNYWVGQCGLHCDLGLVLDSKLNFTSHIESLVLKASRMLSYRRRISKEFRDPYSLKTLHNSFVWSHLDYASVVVWNPYYGEY
jgi:hypothetical protein